MKPIVTIVGRPNVGKSTLFNRLTRTRDALVDDLPGVTRDRHYGEARWNDVEFTVVDTGGFSGGDGFEKAVGAQVEQAVREADVVIMVLDGKAGLSLFDRDLIAMLRHNAKRVLYAVNKIDAPDREVLLAEFYQLGLSRFYPISAEHRYGLSDFLDDLVAQLPKTPPEPEGGVMAVAVVGRPNAGKSSIVNRLLGEDRLLVSEQPGTTRDAIDTLCCLGDRRYRFVDTAGIRRKGRVKAKIEKFSIIKALRSLDRCDVALVVLDASTGVTEQDVSVAGYAYERGCGCVLLLNKWDLVEKDSRSVRRYEALLREKTKFLNFAPVLTVSAKTGQRVQRIFKLLDAVYSQYRRRISTGPLNKMVADAVLHNEPALRRGRRIKFYYATQVSIKPPTFVCFVNYPEAVHFSYRRYLANAIRKATGLDKTPIRLLLQPRDRRRIKMRPSPGRSKR
jgi:GTP-binding protein